MFSISSSGSFNNIEKFLMKMLHGDIYSALAHYGDQGVTALASATPKDTGETAASWFYEIKSDRTSYSIIWGNTHRKDESLIAILVQHGHGTGNGAYISGRDFINPALRPIFDRIADDVWKEVSLA